MPEAEKKLSTPFSLTKTQHSNITQRAQALGMKNASEYLLALYAFDMEHGLRADWNIVPGKATLVPGRFDALAAEPTAGDGHPIQTDPAAIAHAAHPDSVVYSKGKPPRKAKGSSAPK